MPALLVDSVTKVYVTDEGLCACCNREPCIKNAVRDLSFCVNKGEVFGLLGPNGAGKTTSINMITAQIAPSRGKVRKKQNMF
jgi:ABC-type multidrug transport system ATPase subunit